MIRLLIILLFNLFNFEKKDKPVDLRKKEPTFFDSLKVNKILLAIGVVVLFIFFVEFVFLCQGTESGLMRNNMNNI